MRQRVWVILETSLGGYVSVYGVYATMSAAHADKPDSSDIVGYEVEEHLVSE